MHTFRDYWLSMKPGVAREEFALRCGSTVGYLNLVSSGNAKPGEKLAINIERETGGTVPVEQMRPDVDWAVIRARSSPRKPSNTDEDPATSANPRQQAA